MNYKMDAPYNKNARTSTNLMSVMQYLVGQHKLTLQAAWLFLFFQEQVNNGHESQYTQQEIANLNQMSLRTCKKYLDELVVNNYITKEAGYNQHKCTYYTNLLHTSIEEAYQKVYAAQNKGMDDE